MQRSANSRRRREQKFIGPFQYDSSVVPLVQQHAWRGKIIFLKALARAQRRLLAGERGGFFEQMTHEDGTPFVETCCTCHQPVPDSDHIFETPGFLWYSTLDHYVREHNYQPDGEFVAFIHDFAAEGHVLPPKRREKPKSHTTAETDDTKRVHALDVMRIFSNYMTHIIRVLRLDRLSPEEKERQLRAFEKIQNDWNKLGLPPLNWDL